jgi:hypothetical protein
MSMEISCRKCGASYTVFTKSMGGLAEFGQSRVLNHVCKSCGELIPVGEKLPRISSSQLEAGVSPSSAGLIKPPPPPDTSWLRDEVFEEGEIIEDIPLALVLTPEGRTREQVVQTLAKLGYRPESVDTTRVAMEKLRFLNYSCIVMYAELEGLDLMYNPVHRYILEMAMNVRRHIFYALIGSDFHTLYSLQALNHSANLVINDRDISYFSVIMQVALPEYESLFGAYIQELKEHGYY